MRRLEGIQHGARDARARVAEHADQTIRGFEIRVVLAGARPPNPLELLSRDSFAILLHELQREYQVVLIDTPAAEPCADAQTVAFRAGGALVLARKDYTNLKATSRLIRALGDAGASVAGTVLNSF